MSRWIWVCCCAVLLSSLTLSLGAAATPTSSSSPATPTKKTSLQQRLEKGLKARRKSEFTYIAEVVELVDKGKLPEKIVDGTFFEARRHPRPMQHFQFALAARGKLLHLPTPSFDPLAK
ncbi:MAG: hypothetical protein R3C10_00930 [Pirellulales bacterium]